MPTWGIQPTSYHHGTTCSVSKCLRSWKTADMWRYSTYTSAFINHEHRCDCPAHLFGMTPWDFLPQFSWVKSHPNSSRFSLQPLLWEAWPGVVQIWFGVGPFQGTSWSGRQKHGRFQAGCPGGIWWFSGTFFGQMKGWFETGRDHSSRWRSKKERLFGDGCDKGVYPSELHEKRKASSQLKKSTLGAIL